MKYECVATIQCECGNIMEATCEVQDVVALKCAKCGNMYTMRVERGRKKGKGRFIHAVVNLYPA